MKTVLVVGSGAVAEAALPWLVRRFRVLALCRRPERAAQLRALGARPVLADLDNRASLRRLAGLARWVLHFAPPASQGDRDLRTRRLLAALGNGKSLAQRLVYISTTGVYGDCRGEWIDECRPLAAQTARAYRRVDAERALRRFGRRGGRRVAILRAPGIYGPGRLPLDRLRRGDPVPCAGEGVHTNHVHLDDLARAACFALFRGRPNRVVNACDGSALRVDEWFDAIAAAFALPQPPRLPHAQLAEYLSPMALSFMSESRRIGNRRLREELRVVLHHPSPLEAVARIAAEGFNSTGENH